MAYMREVILAGEPSEVIKRRTITLRKSELVTDVNQLTYKYSNKAVEDSVARGMVESDTQDNLDGTIIARFMKYRDAKLRRFLRHALAPEEKETASDVMVIDEDFVYSLDVREGFSDSMLESMAELMHKYIIWGTLSDWYMHLNEGQMAANLLSQLDEVEDELVDIFRSPSIVKRPLQPFGPARKWGDRL